MKNLLTRTLTGIFIVLIVLGGILLHPVTFFLVQLTILTGSLFEYYRIIENDSVRPYKFAGMIAGIALYVVSVAVASGSASASWFLILLPLIAAIMVTELYRKNERPFDSIAHTIAGLVYIALPWSLVPFASFGTGGIGTIMEHSVDGFTPGAILAFFLLLWSNDTGAYLVGVSVGRHRLFQRISPKKSWEGFFGGMAATVLVAFFLSDSLGITGRVEWIIIALIVSVAGTFGDLVESMLKRGAGIKDSGSIMPGHGGFLDRFDSVLLAWPMMFLFLTFFG